VISSESPGVGSGGQRAIVALLRRSRSTPRPPAGTAVTAFSCGQLRRHSAHGAFRSCFRLDGSQWSFFFDKGVWQALSVAMEADRMAPRSLGPSMDGELLPAQTLCVKNRAGTQSPLGLGQSLIPPASSRDRCKPSIQFLQHDNTFLMLWLAG